MRRTIVVPINELVEHTASRIRARQAYDNLVRRAEDVKETVRFIVDLSEAPLLTGSFLDELVLRLRERRVLSVEDVVFRVPSEEQARTLKKVCAVRSTRCAYQIGESGEVKKTTMKRSKEIEPQPHSGAFFTT